ncbi:MAG: hypothetical protein M0P12_00260 [Paludibacteraceae bacterium]|nr:hypothetical protein [Paludibacteraceae bacterium]
MRRKDLTGRSFGKLYVIGLFSTTNHKQLYSCMCECGIEFIAEAGNIRSGHTTSCGSCSKVLDITGERFGKLVAIESVGKRKNKSLWKCLCDCGCTTYGEVSLLRSGHKLSCGCLVSRAEMEFKIFLERNGYSFQTQFSFPDCLYVRRLKFDFAIFKGSNLLCLVELQGEQHFSPITFKKGKTLSADEFQTLQIRDKIKTEYCKKNNIPLLLIDYRDFKHKESIFLSWIKTLCGLDKLGDIC